MTDASRFELFSYWRTSATYRVRVAFNLKGVVPTEHNVDLDAGEQRGDAFLKINPMGAIPALIDHAPGASAAPLTQSLAILEFIDETHPAPPLLPADAHGRARVRSIASMLAADTHPLVTPRVKKYLMTTAKFDDAAWRAWQLQWFGSGLQALEQRLATDAATGRFCHGDAPTIADICWPASSWSPASSRSTCRASRRSTASWRPARRSRRLRTPIRGARRARRQPEVGHLQEGGAGARWPATTLGAGKSRRCQTGDLRFGFAAGEDCPAPFVLPRNRS